jgi:hypothetical protein
MVLVINSQVRNSEIFSGSNAVSAKGAMEEKRTKWVLGELCIHQEFEITRSDQLLFLKFQHHPNRSICVLSFPRGGRPAHS